MSAEKVVANTLRIAQEDLSAAKLLFEAGNRNAAYHCQQAAEKLIRAVLTSEQIQIELRESHLLQRLIGKLPDENPLKSELRKIQMLERFATTYKYATPDGGKILPSIEPSEFEESVAVIDAVLEEVAKRFGVDLTKDAKAPASNLRPIR